MSQATATRGHDPQAICMACDQLGMIEWPPRMIRQRFTVADDKKGKPERAKTREARLAEQLRANLSKRKALVKVTKVEAEKG